VKRLLIGGFVFISGMAAMYLVFCWMLGDGDVLVLDAHGTHD
jgi:hypothetical protein